MAGALLVRSAGDFRDSLRYMELALSRGTDSVAAGNSNGLGTFRKVRERQAW